jgi:ribose 5-phosphate isomerase B
MTIYIGADHRGYALKEIIKHRLQNYAIHECGAETFTPGDDYVDYAAAVATAVMKDPNSRGVVICGSGVGVAIVANKIPGIRCGLGFSTEQVKASRADDDINILAIPADFVSEDEAFTQINIFLQTPFSQEERHKRRIEKIHQLEHA